MNNPLAIAIRELLDILKEDSIKGLDIAVRAVALVKTEAVLAKYQTHFLIPTEYMEHLIYCSHYLATDEISRRLRIMVKAAEEKV